jgi:hypothetical protein
MLSQLGNNLRKALAAMPWPMLLLKFSVASGDIYAAICCAIIFVLSKNGLLVLRFHALRCIAQVFFLAQLPLAQPIYPERMDHLLDFQNRRLLMAAQQFFRMIFLLHQVVDPFDFATTATALA